MKLPRLSVWALRAALVYLAVGFTLGALLLWNKGVPLNPGLWKTLPAHIEFVLVGWTVQLIMGTAFWILPRFSEEPKRGNVPLAWSAFGLLNLGLLIAGLGPLWNTTGWFPLVGRLLEVTGALAFALHAWPRVYKR